jgi:3-hydroxyisobutyryl-CoA hydrolase
VDWPSSKFEKEDFKKLVATNPSLPPIELLRSSSYHQYPHRHLTMPSEADVKRVVRGEEPSVGDFAFQTRDQVESWFVKHWPTRSLLQENIHDLNALRANSSNGALPPIEGFEMQIGKGKVGIQEHVREIIDRCCTVDEKHGVKWNR